MRRFEPEHLRTPMLVYSQQKRNAKRRGIEFILSFEEWWSVWQASKCWENRGPTSDQYVMARFGDNGPYALGNIKIIRQAENIRERHIGKYVSSKTRDILRKNAQGNKNWKGRSHSPETKEKISRANIGRIRTEETKIKLSLSHLGHRHTEHTKAKMSASRMGRVFSEETRKKISLSKLGNKSNLGRKLSEETKRKISNSKKRRV